MSSQIYLKNILDFIESKKELSRKEFKNTNINTADEYNENEKWFSDLIDYVNKSPPVYFVKHLKVKEDNNGNILKIGYKYFDRDEILNEPTLFIITNLVNKEE